MPNKCPVGPPIASTNGFEDKTVDQRPANPVKVMSNLRRRSSSSPTPILEDDDGIVTDRGEKLLEKRNARDASRNRAPSPIRSDIVFANCAESERDNSQPNGSEATSRRNESTFVRNLSFLKRTFSGTGKEELDERREDAALQLQLRVRRLLYGSYALHRRNLGDRLVFESDLLRGFRRLCSQVCITNGPVATDSHPFPGIHQGQEHS